MTETSEPVERAAEWRPASKGTAEVNMYPASDVKSVETGASTITIKP